MKSLAELYRAHQGKVSDKWSSYLGVYDRLFTPLRDKPIRLLEIGVQNGGSLEIWAEYFFNAELVVGCDIDPACGRLAYADPRISVVIANAADEQGYRAVNQVSPHFDVIIDDGSHRSSDIVRSFALFFPCLRHNGIFVAEDLHCGYWQEFEGGLYDPYSSIGFFKTLTDVVNFEHWGVDRSRTAFLRHLSAHYDVSFDERTLEGVGVVEFHNSICAVRKQSNANALGTRTVAGNECDVQQDSRVYSGTTIAPQAQHDNRWSTRDVPLEAELFQQEQHIHGLVRLLADRDVQLTQMMAERNTYGARVGRALTFGRQRLCPSGSFRAALLNHALGPSEWLFRHVRHGLRQARTFLRQTSGSGATSQDCRAQLLAPSEYQEWIETHEPSPPRLAEDATALAQSSGPLISVILPVYKVSAEILEAAVQSVVRQTYPRWEVCIAYADVENEDNWRMLQELASRDSRIRPLRMEQNGGISTNSNAALAIARGEFIALLDHDDELTPWALADMAREIAKDPEIDFLYSDKDSIDASGSARINPLFKPGWSPEMLYSVNYLTHLNVMRRSLVQAVGGWRSEFDGAQDWDLFYRVTERSRKIARVAGVHYHWRIIPSSTATGLSAKPYAAFAQLRTQEERVLRLGLPAVVIPEQETGFRLLWRLGKEPVVDLVIRMSESDSDMAWLSSHLRDDLGSLLSSATLVQRKRADGKGHPARLQNLSAKVLEYRDTGDEAGMMQRAAQLGGAPVLMFLDANVVRLAGASLRELTGWLLLHPEIAFASGITLTDNDCVVEAGRAFADNGRTAPLFRNTPLRHWSVFGGPLWYRNVSAAYPYLAGCKRDDWNRSLAAGRPTGSWQETFAAQCVAMAADRRRGLVTPHARAYVQAMPLQAPADTHESYSGDPYFHPAFASVSPLSLHEPQTIN